MDVYFKYQRIDRNKNERKITILILRSENIIVDTPTVNCDLICTAPSTVLFSYPDYLFLPDTYRLFVR